MTRSLDLLVSLLFATFICFLDRSAFSYVLLPIQQEFSLSDAQMGFIGSGFGIGYLLLVGFSGFIVDRFGPFKVWAISGVLWFLILVATSQAEGFSSLFILRILLGSAESVHFPCLLKTVFNCFEPSYRTRSIALTIMAIPLSFILGGPFTSSLLIEYSWRGVFIALGLYSLIWAAISFYFLYIKEFSDPLHHPRLNLQEIKTSLKSFFSSKTFVAICAMAFVFDFILYFFLTWFPYYLETVFQLNSNESGFLLTIPWITALILLIFGGWLSDYLFRKTHSLRISRSYLMFGGYFLSAISFFLLLSGPNLPIQVVLFSSALGFVFFSAGPLFLLNVDLFPKHCSAALGVFISFGALAQFLSPALIGIFREVTGNFLSSLFLTGSIAFIGAMISILFVRPVKILDEH